MALDDLIWLIRNPKHVFNRIIEKGPVESIVSVSRIIALTFVSREKNQSNSQLESFQLCSNSLEKQIKAESVNHRLSYLGSNWGGWTIDVNLVQKGSTVISAGLGNDLTFDIELIKHRSCFVVGIDPTRQAYHHVKQVQFKGILNKNNFSLISKALYGTSGVLITLGGPAMTVFSSQGETVKTITLGDVMKDIKNISILKLDIEGSEYSVLEQLDQLNIPQVCIEFHHWLNDETDQYPGSSVEHQNTLKDSIDCIKKIKSFGYKLVYISNDDDRRIVQETLFIREDLASDYKDIDLSYNGI